MLLSNSVDRRTVERCDGGREIVFELFSRPLSEQYQNLLVMPGEGVSLSAKVHLLEVGGGISGNILTPRKLAERIYDLSGSELPVLDLSAREILVKRILGSEDFPRLKARGPPRLKMARYISKEIGELIQGNVDPSELKGGRKDDLRSVLSKYLEELKARELVDPEQVPFLAAEWIDNGGNIPWKRMALYILGEQPVSHRRIIEALMKRMDKVISVDHASTTGAPSQISIPPRGKRGRQVLKAQTGVKTLRAPTPWEEVGSIARYIKDRILKGDLEPWEISVVFPSRRQYDHLIRVLFERYGLPLQMGKDLRLDSVPSVKVIIDILRCHLDNYPRDGILKPLSTGLIYLPDDLDWKDLERITRTFHILGGGKDPIHDWVDILSEVSKDEDQERTIRDQANAWSSWMSDLILRLKVVCDGKVTVRERCKGVDSLITFLGIEKGLPETDEHGGNVQTEGIDRFSISLRSLIRRSSLLDQGIMDMDDFMEVLSLELEKEKLSTLPRGRGIKVLGLEGAVGENFRLCIIGGLNSGSIPSPPSGFRMITEKERIDLGMSEITTRRKQLEDLCTVICSSEEAVISYHDEEKGRPVMISPFIEELERDELEVPGGLFSLTDVSMRIGELSDPSFHLYDKRVEIVDELMYDTEALIGILGEDRSKMTRKGLIARSMRLSSGKNPFNGSVMEDQNVNLLRSRFGPDHIWSASRLETYRECPYVFFIKYVIGVKEREDLEPGVPPERKGLIFHSIAERFYEKWTSAGRRRVLPGDLPLAREVMKEVSFEVLSKHNYCGPYWDALKDLLLGTEVEEGLLDEFLDVEASYSGLFNVDDVEMGFGPVGGADAVSISIPGQDGGPDRFRMQGSIDRVDRLSSESGDMFFIWDYKTGRTDVSEDSLQVPLYLAALRKLHPGVFSGGGGYYYLRRKGSVRRDPVLGKGTWEMENFDRERTRKDLDVLNERIGKDIETVLLMIDSIRLGDFSPDPSCRSRTCPYRDICRRGEDL